MSSPPPSTKPYKSRLFNFVNRNYIKFNSKVNVKIREFGYVVQGGLQTLVFPLFWLWETTKKLSKSFVASPQSHTSLPTGENPENIDNSTDNRDLVFIVNNAINNEPNLPCLPPKNFQGLASLLKDKRLIFVLEKNKVKDIIPLNQQSQVNLLINNLADDFESRKLLPSNTNFFSKIFSGLNIFRKSKVEQNISQDINNFQSSDLVINSSVNHHSIITLIDNLLVSLEKLTFPNSSSIEPQNQDTIEETQEKISILRLIRQALDYFFKAKNSSLLEDNLTGENSLITNDNSGNLPPAQITIQNIITKSQETAENIIPQIQETTEKIITQGLNQLNIAKNKLNNPDDPFQIQVLIWAAINYFFTQKNSSLSANSKKSFLPSFSETEIILINDEITDPWLSWEDLYSSNPPLSDTIDHDNNDSNFILTDDQSSIEHRDFMIETSEIIESLSVENEQISINVSSAKNTVLDTPKTEKKASIEKKSTNNLADKQVTFEEEIEVKVIEIKYEKHFLEIILEKLDRLILWLEEVLIKIVNKVKLLTKNN